MLLQIIHSYLKIHTGTKFKYMVFSRSREEFDTRIAINEKPIERTYDMIHLAVWISYDFTRYKRILEICRIAYPRER